MKWVKTEGLEGRESMHKKFKKGRLKIQGKGKGPSNRALCFHWGPNLRTVLLPTITIYKLFLNISSLINTVSSQSPMFHYSHLSYCTMLNKFLMTMTIINNCAVTLNKKFNILTIFHHSQRFFINQIYLAALLTLHCQNNRCSAIVNAAFCV